jgi:iron complex outermembrane receptor protein
VRAANLTDEKARDNTSLLKDVAPLPGRNVSLGLTAAF